MKSFNDVEEVFNIKFPEQYLNVLKTFELYFEFEKNDVVYELYGNKKLFSNISTDLLYFQYMSIWTEKKISEHQTFVFGSSGDGKRIFFNLDDMSIWELWLDDKSMNKIYDNFDTFMAQSIFLDKE